MRNPGKGRGLLRVGLVGCGQVARRAHIPVLGNHPEFEVVAVADTDTEGREAAAKAAPGSRSYASLPELLRNEELDVLDICTPPHLHAEMIKSALRGGLHVLCEKPLVLSPTEFGEIVALSRETGRLLYSVHNWTFAPQFQLIHRWIQEGAIGALKRLHLETLRTAPAFLDASPGDGAPAPSSGNWRLQNSQAGGGILVDHGWHLFSLVLRLVGESPRRVWCRTSTRRFRNSELEDTALCEIEFPSGVTALLSLSWAEDIRKNAGLLLGARGTILLDDDRVELRAPKGPTRSQEFDEALSAGSAHPEWFRNIVSHFLFELKNPRERKNLDEAGLCLAILTAAYRSARQGSSAVELPREGEPERIQV